MSNKPKLFWIVIFAAILFTMSACGGDDDVGVQGSGNNAASQNQDDSLEEIRDNVYSSPLAALSSPLDDIETARWTFNVPNENYIVPEADIEYGFVFAVNRGLLFGQFNGQAATPLSERIVTDSVSALPDGRIIYRGHGDVSRNSIVIHDPYMDAVVGEYLSVNDGQILNWNADGTWLTFRDDDVFVAAADGTFTSEPLKNVDESIWLDDDTLLYTVEDDDGAIVSVMRYSPVAKTSAELRLDFDPANDNLLSLEDDIRELGYRYASPTIFELTSATADGDTRYSVRPPDTPSALGICDEWRIEKTDLENGEREYVYTADSTHALTNLNVLPDDSVLVLRWFRDECAFSNPIQTQLLHLMPDGTVELITDSILASTNQVQPLALERFYSVSPDGRYLMWIGRDGGLEDDTTLEVLDLETGIQKRVAQMPLRATGGYNILILTVAWVE